jgi:leucyl aminopeptidase
MALSANVASAPSSDAVVVYGVGAKKDKLVLQSLPSSLKKRVEELFKNKVFKAGFKSTYYFPELPPDLQKDVGAKGVLLVGIGDMPSDQKEARERLRRLGAVIGKTANASNVRKIAVDVASFSSRGEDAGLCLYEGAALIHYAFNEYRRKPKELSVGSFEMILKNKKKLDRELKKVAALVDGVHFARTLGNTPPNDLPPAELAARAVAMAKKLGMSTTVLDMKEIKKEGLNLLDAVGRGSANLPRLIVLEYNKSKKNAPHLCLIGKGLTFDSGGISIKPAQGMEEMKFDMMGSAAVLGATQAIATLKLPLRLTTIVASAENMSGDEAIRPGDIFKSHKGIFVEINNTDAEGRLVLADAISYAQKYHKPDMIVDVATLTGACVIALGNSHSGIMSNHAKLTGQIKAASELAGENLWPLPLSPYDDEDMDSLYADVRNTGAIRAAGASKGALFLQRFVDEGTPWAHLDIAGTAYVGSHMDYHPKGGTGVMVRTLTLFAENIKKPT